VKIRRVQDFAEAYACALIRNECRQWMTNDTKVIGVGEQVEFFKRVWRNNSPRFFIACYGYVPVGYAIIKVEGKSACLTGGIAKDFRGRGLGRELFEYLIAYCIAGRLKPWLSVLRSNRRAIRLYKSLGFEITRFTKRIYTMEYKP
jgi:ribosomal protein S18 acetylase RimI-like enzyme